MSQPARSDAIKAQIPDTDPEHALAEHRFGWVPRLLAAGPSDAQLREAVDQAASWVRNHPPGEGTPGWDAYSVAERIAQWVLLASAVKRWGAAATPGAWLARSLAEHAGFLRAHLELRGAATNNHLINDGRALYLAGAFLGERAYESIGRELLGYGLRTMLTPSGFLREGSAHYHLLVSRTYLEVLALADACGDRSFQEEILERVVDMASRAAFLLGNGTLPLIGDVSPDAPPQFFEGVPLVGAIMAGARSPAPPPHAAGWHRLFVSPAAESDTAGKISGAESFPDAGYHRLRATQPALTLYANPLGYVPAWSHGHADLGGFVLDWGGRPLLVDCGRATYGPTSLGRYGRSVRSHNAISLDGFEPIVVHAHNGFVTPMLPEYLGTPPRVAISEGDGRAELTLVHDGYARLQPGLVVIRSFAVTGHSVRIIDRVEGAGEHEIETFFHLHPSVSPTVVDQATVELRTEKIRLILRGSDVSASALDVARGRRGERLAGWFSPMYGAAVPTATIRFTRRTMLPAQHEYLIEELR
jgi:hypothetical protein